ncbi:hypothetical protein B9Z55_015993 [Caenorhabditis nigoni]|uniref:Uncharacterized protein n=1 Tax=Caenorhabditis nigoni TaxID=1611254 RepID=A0A2G5UCU2_9PELO|nr:hypothetical protein B9Z55_015993 [Caenorhabditis nigoni]
MAEEEEEIVLKEIEFFGDSFVFQDSQKINQEEDTEEGEIVEDSDENKETSRKRPHPEGDDQIQQLKRKCLDLEEIENRIVGILQLTRNLIRQKNKIEIRNVRMLTGWSEERCREEVRIILEKIQAEEQEEEKKRLENAPNGDVPEEQVSDDDPIPEDPFQNPPEYPQDEIPEDPIQGFC